jgi:TonB family protein
VATRTAPTRPAAPASATPVEILDKPRPAYTEEARRLSVEGEVLIEVLFEASGQTKVQRLIRGLGHGLDVNAMSAARQIRFRPARQEGAAVDSLAVVHILFQLAY